MTNPLLTRSRAAHQALEVLVEKQSKGVPAHFQSQVAGLRRDLNRLKTALDSGAFQKIEVAVVHPQTVKEFMEGAPEVPDEVYDRSPAVEAELVCDVAEYVGKLVKRLTTGPIRKPELAAAAAELGPLAFDLKVEADRLVAALRDYDDPNSGLDDPDDGPDGTWPAGINLDADDPELDLGRKE